jgi:hypothetical protein
MSGGMMQGYGAARTSGMGLEDQSLMPGKMVRASKGKLLSAKQKKIARMAPPPDKITGADFKAMKAKYGKMVKMNKGGGMDMGAKKSKMLNFKSDKERKDYTKQAIASLEGITESFKDKLNPMKAQRLLDRLPKKKIKKVYMNKGGGMDMGAKKPLSFKEQLEQARAEGKVEKTPTSKYLKKRSRGDRINALLKAANVPNMNKGGKIKK